MNCKATKKTEYCITISGGKLEDLKRTIMDATDYIMQHRDDTDWSSGLISDLEYWSSHIGSIENIAEEVSDD